MYAKETAKRTFERLTGIGRPSRQEAAAHVRKRKAWPTGFADDGLIPNNPKLPFVHYRGAVNVKGATDPPPSSNGCSKERVGRHAGATASMITSTTIPARMRFSVSPAARRGSASGARKEGLSC